MRQARPSRLCPSEIRSKSKDEFAGETTGTALRDCRSACTPEHTPAPDFEIDGSTTPPARSGRFSFSLSER